MTSASLPLALALPSDLLTLLAQAAEPAAALRNEASSPLGALAEALPALLARTVLRSAPADASDRSRWLDQLDQLDRAQSACARLDASEFPWAPALAGAFDQALVEREQAVRTIDVDEGLGLRAQADKSRRGQRPWRWLPGLLDATPSEAVFEAWAQGHASADEASELRRRVAEEGRWQRAYQAFLAAYAEGLIVPASAPGAERRSVLALPHLGPDAALHVEITGTGTRWSWPGREPMRLGAGAAVARFEGDPISNPLEIALTRDNDPLDRAWSVLGQLRSLTEAPVDEASALPVACALAEQLAGPAWVAAFEQAHACYDRGDDLDDDLSAWVRHGLEARLRLEALAAELLAPELFEALERVDEALDSHGPALGALTEQDYLDALAFGGLPRGWARWREEEQRADDAMPLGPALRRWGQQQAQPPAAVRFDDETEALLARSRLWSQASLRLAPDVPTMASMQQASSSRAPGIVGLAASSDEVLLGQAGSDDAMQRMQALRTASRAEQPAAFQRVQRALQRTPCPWLREDLRAALAQIEAEPQLAELAPTLRFLMRPVPGCAPLLVALAGTGLGDVWQLRIQPRPHDEPGDPWERVPQLRAAARDAIRAAFTVAASRMPQGLPRYAFEDHVIEVVGGALPVEGLDGDSLGLAAALAFASLWLDLPLADEVAATAALRHRGDWRPCPVGYVSAKAEALARLRQGRPVRLLLASSASAAPAGVTVAVVASFDEALEQAGLGGAEAQRARESYRPRLPLLADRLRLLQTYHHHVHDQELAHYQGQGADPWLMLGDRIRTLVRSLDGATDAASRRQAAESRIDAALAFTHALDADGIDDMLAGVDPSLLPPQLSVYARIVALGALIDDCIRGKRPWSEGDPLVEALDRALDALPTADRENLEGRALGTQGRFWMHQHRLDRALPLLRASVASHDRHLWHEAGRSRIYLATALRLGGQLAEAARTLDEATALLDRCEREWSAPYAAQTRLFWGYELARLLLDMGRPQDAIAVAEQLLPRTRQVGAWPQAGLLRTLAWAYRVVGRQSDHASAVEALRTCAGSDGFLRGLVHEAEEGYRRDGEVY